MTQQMGPRDTAGVPHLLTQLEGLAETVAALPHQRVVRVEGNPLLLEVDDRGEDVGGAVEQRPGQHRGVDPLAVGIALRGVGRPRAFEADSRGVDPRAMMGNRGAAVNRPPVCA